MHVIHTFLAMMRAKAVIHTFLAMMRANGALK